MTLFATDDLTFSSTSESSELAATIDSLNANSFPAFMMWSSPGNWRWHRIYSMFPSYQIAAFDKNGVLLGSANSVPVCWPGQPANLPGGYDDVLVTSTDANFKPRTNAVCLLAIAVANHVRGRHVPTALMQELKRRAAQSGDMAVIAPLRPTKKCLHPGVAMTEYISWKNENGEAFDPWLRTHIGLGAKVLGVAEKSITITQPLSRWRQIGEISVLGISSWIVPGALSPIIVDPEQQYGTYVEPNIWVCHWL